MVNIGSAVGLLSLGLTLSDRQDRREAEREAEELKRDLRRKTGKDASGPPGAAAQVETVEKLEELIDLQATNEPGPGDKDAFASAVITLNPGETAEITVEPNQGVHLLVKRVEIDRRDDHTYEFNVAGDVTSVAHRAVYARPKRVTQSDNVIATVTNDTGGTTTTVDFELEAWAEVT